MNGKAFFSILLTLLLVSGCSSLHSSCQKDIQELTTANVDLRKELADLTAKENEKRTQVETLERERNSLKVDIAALAEENKNLKSSMAVKEPAPAEKTGQPNAEQIGTLNKSNKEFRIKVLTGTGKMQSARLLSKKITKMGYRVKKIDRAGRSNFTNDTVYYAQDAEKAAREMAERLGGKTIIKPLTWPTDFDIIVVAGRQ
jgi:predicted nuclease with TOPRIM domain